MRLQHIFSLVAIGLGVWAGLGDISLWWALFPAFMAGTFGLANGPHYAAVIDANRRGSLWLFPTQLAINWAGQMILPIIVYFIARWLA